MQLHTDRFDSFSYDFHLTSTKIPLFVSSEKCGFRKKTPLSPKQTKTVFN